MGITPPGLRRPHGTGVTGWKQIDWCFRVAAGFWSAACLAAPLFRPAVEALGRLGIADVT